MGGLRTSTRMQKLRCARGTKDVSSARGTKDVSSALATRYGRAAHHLVFERALDLADRRRGAEELVAEADVADAHRVAQLCATPARLRLLREALPWTTA